MSDKTTAKAWSDAIAALVVDALRYAKIVQKDDNDRAIEIAAAEIYARLCVHDYPPHMDGDPSANDT